MLKCSLYSISIHRVLIVVDSWVRAEKERNLHQGIDLATTLERIEKNFVITDPRLPDNPIVCLNLMKRPYCSHLRR